MKNPSLVERFEQRLIREADAVIVVIEEMRDRLIALGAEPERLSIVSNTPDLGDWPKAPSWFGRSGPLRVIFVGLINPMRGVGTVIEALGLMGSDREVLFDVVGNGYNLDDLKSQALRGGVADRVVFHGWVDHDRLPDILAGADLGIIPHQVSEHTNTTIPNKIFDYMAASLPVIVSNALPLKRIIQDHHCGFSFQGGNARNLADVLSELPERSILEGMGENGRQAVEKHYHWSVDYDRLIRVIDRIVAVGN